ncbi:MAG: serine/threonine protein kinase [Planctomycetes bacterium]|nr:serine/threonine protein kinase [Planctomycetota bacterium]
MPAIFAFGYGGGAMLVGQQIGPFEIEKELGSGAMGTVYRAKFHKREDRVIPVALKVVSLGLLGNESAMARFEREANILKQLKHPHIVRLIATGHYKNTPFIAMEYIDGEALDRVLARRGKLTWEEVLSYGKQLCEGLQYAHDKGIIHRDLKPSNLMITRDGTLKLTDFGIAKDTDVTALTGANSTIGTAAYMSPEQCKGDKNLSNKSDLYSLGIVFFELLTGRKPFMAETTVEMFLKHVNERAPRIGKIVPDLPPKFESLILQLMEKDKETRPIDAAWVARLLQEIEDDQFARKSAGLIAAQARTAKPTNQAGDKMDAADREAARALRGTKKKKKKPAAVPLLRQKWLRGVGILAVLGAIAGGVYYAAKPPSMDKMYSAIDRAETPDAKAEAAARFLEVYGDRGGETVDKAAAVFRDGKVRERERQLTNRFASNLIKPAESDDPEAYAAAWQAMEAERVGALDDAEHHWTRVKGRFPDEAKLPYTLKDDVLAKARWGWLADKRIADLAAVRTEYGKLKKKIADSRPLEQPLKNDATSPESLAIRAMRLRDFGDHDRAARVCDTLVHLTEKDPDKRTWYLLASQMKVTLNRPGADPVGARIQRLTNWLDATEKQAKELQNKGDGFEAARRDVRNRCREVTELYDDDKEGEVQKQVDRAAKIAGMVPRS